MADIYIHLLILGYNIDDIVAFMTSPSIRIISPLISGNIFDGTNISSFRLAGICNGKLDSQILPMFKSEKMQEVLDQEM